MTHLDAVATDDGHVVPVRCDGPGCTEVATVPLGHPWGSIITHPESAGPSSREDYCCQDCLNRALALVRPG